MCCFHVCQVHVNSSIHPAVCAYAWNVTALLVNSCARVDLFKSTGIHAVPPFRQTAHTSPVSTHYGVFCHAELQRLLNSLGLVAHTPPPTLLLADTTPWSVLATRLVGVTTSGPLVYSSTKTTNLSTSTPKMAPAVPNSRSPVASISSRYCR